MRTLRKTGKAKPFAGRPCYHTELDTFSLAGREVGIVGRVVGASFAVLVAEELFASACRLLVSLTSAGQIVPSGPPPYFVFIDRALRDEGTSYHYAPPSEFAEADPQLVMAAARAMFGKKLRAVVGASWTTDAPFRETEEAIEAARAKGILAVEMEAAALHTFARTARVRLLFQDFGFALSPSSTRRRTASDRVGLSSCFSAHLTIAARVAGSADSRLGSYAGRGSPRTTEVMKRRRRSILADGGA